MKEHVCGVGELDYGNASDGYILCDVCGRMFRLTDKGWVANPPIVGVVANKWKSGKRYARRKS